MKNNEKEKSASPILVLIIFFVLLVSLFIAPEVYNKFNNDGKNNYISSNKDDKKRVIEVNERQAVSEKYILNSSESISFNEIILTNANIENEKLTFRLKLKENGSLNLDVSNYYIELYDNDTFVGRRALLGVLSGTETYNIDISNISDNITHFIISHISDDSIPKINYNSDESGLSSLVCEKDNSSYEYTLNLGLLIRVVKKYSYSSDDFNEYSNVLFKTQKEAKGYNEKSGVVASIAENNTSFIYTIEFDYEESSNFDINDKYIFKKNTLGGVIEFKMDAEGYICHHGNI